MPGQDWLDAAVFHQFVEIFAGIPTPPVFSAHGRNAEGIGQFYASELCDRFPFAAFLSQDTKTLGASKPA